MNERIWVKKTIDKKFSNGGMRPLSSSVGFPKDGEETGAQLLLFLKITNMLLPFKLGINIFCVLLFRQSENKTHLLGTRLFYILRNLFL